MITPIYLLAADWLPWGCANEKRGRYSKNENEEVVDGGRELDGGSQDYADVPVTGGAVEPSLFCDTENAVPLNFGQETKTQWQHDGFYSCDALCSLDEGDKGKPVFSRAEDSLDFVAPVCRNASQVRFIFDAKLPDLFQPDDRVKALLKLPFRQTPISIYFSRQNECSTSASVDVNLGSENQLGNILPGGHLPVWLGGVEKIARGAGESAKQIDPEGECVFDGPSWILGLSGVKIVSCYESEEECEHPLCLEQGAFRCIGSVLEECTPTGWMPKQMCSEMQKCSEEGHCLDAQEVCGPTQRLSLIGLNQSTSSTSCQPLCAQDQMPLLPLLLHDIDIGMESRVWTNFNLPELFQDPDVIYIDIVSKVIPPAILDVDTGNKKQSVKIDLDCTSYRTTFPKGDTPLDDDGEVFVTISPNFVTDFFQHAHRDDQYQCVLEGEEFAVGLSDLSLTPCKTNYVLRGE